MRINARQMRKKSMTGLENGKLRNSWEVKKLSGFYHQKQDQPRHMPILRLIKKDGHTDMSYHAIRRQ